MTGGSVGLWRYVDVAELVAEFDTQTDQSSPAFWLLTLSCGHDAEHPLVIEFGYRHDAPRKVRCRTCAE